jgi:type IV secretory pathway VirD2 relaxase
MAPRPRLRSRLRAATSLACDDISDFRPRPERIRDRGARHGRRPKSFFAQVMKAAVKANGGPLTSAKSRDGSRGRPRSTRPRKGRCSRIGRGQAAADRLKLAAGQRAPSQRMRRVVVKARIVRLKAGSRAAIAHLNYLQRDGTTRDGGRGQLYGPDVDPRDGRAFVERGHEDRHQFRFIVAPEDGDRLSDLRGFTRDVMRQMEQDLGTRLDWVAVDHFNTGHPHSHVVIRGKDDLGKDLIIAQDYITDGLRLRTQERVTLELGPETDVELRTKLQAEISAERFTRIDRAMISEADNASLDLRPDAGQSRADFDRTLRIGRLQVLRRFGLASEAEPGVWHLSDQLEPAMRELGERGDIIKSINRSLAARGEARSAEDILLHGGATSVPVIGRVIGKELTDELGDRVGIIIDGIDGRVHHVVLGGAAMADEARLGAIVEIGRASSAPRPADRNIAELSKDTGEYRPSEHRAIAEAGHVRVPGGDYDGYVESHVRRLEALRRAGIVERTDADRWRIPDNFEARAQAYDAAQGRRASLRVLSAYDLDRQITSDGSTWLDRQLVNRADGMLAEAGFGAEVRSAFGRRKDELIRQGHAWRTPEGRVRARGDLLPVLERQEVERVGRKLAAEQGLAFHAVEDGQTIRGKLVGSTRLASGRFAMIDDGQSRAVAAGHRDGDRSRGRRRHTWRRYLLAIRPQARARDLGDSFKAHAAMLPPDARGIRSEMDPMKLPGPLQITATTCIPAAIKMQRKAGNC